MNALELELLHIEQAAVAAERQRLADAEHLLALVDDGLAHMRATIAQMAHTLAPVDQAARTTGEHQ